MKSRNLFKLELTSEYVYNFNVEAGNSKAGGLVDYYKTALAEAAPDEVFYEGMLGFVTSVGDGIAYVHGMEDVRAGELVSFIGSDLYGLALNLEADRVGVVIFGSDRDVVEGDAVVATGQIVDVL